MIIWRSFNINIYLFIYLFIHHHQSTYVIHNISPVSLCSVKACHLIKLPPVNLSPEAFSPGGGTPYVMGDTYVPRFWPPFFTLAGSSTIFLGCFFSSTNTKTIFWVQILTKFDLFGPKIPFFPRSFWVQFSVARGTPPAIFGPSTPPRAFS